MKFTHNILYIALLLVATGCTFLDVSDELAGNLTQEEVFNDPAMTRRWHRNIFTGIPDYSNILVKDIGSGTEFGFGNPWTALSDELTFGYANEAAYAVQGGYNAGTAKFNRWNTLYQLIRQANIFFEKSHTIPQVSEQLDFLDEAELQQLTAQARFLRAFYHYMLFELYGPVPIVTEVLSPYGSELDLPRNSVDEVVKWICDEMQALIDEEGGLSDVETDQNRLALPTKGVAYAVIAKTKILAASPLFNGGYAEALTLTNADGKRLFPDKDPNKWQEAKTAMDNFIRFADGKYQLFTKYKSDGTVDADASLYDMFMSYNNEIVWASSKTYFNALTATGYDKLCTPFSEQKGLMTASPMQELVDDFFMADGLTIDESPNYVREGFSTVSGQAIYNQWMNREPRFYQCIFYQGRKWQVKNNPIFFYNGSNNGVDKAPNSYPAAGYLLFKRTCKKLYNSGSYPKVQYRPSIIFRLADFYLLYAEVLNEVDPTDSRIVEYIDKVRERAGIPLLADIKPDIIGNYEKQAEAIRRERRVELCTEGQRYFDVRRWMLAETGRYRQGGDFHGMNTQGEKGNKNDFYQVVKVETRKFDKKMYLYPIPLNQVQMSRQMVQNPGW